MEIYVSKLKAAKILFLGLSGALASGFFSWKIYLYLTYSFRMVWDVSLIGMILNIIFGLMFLLGILVFGCVTVIFGKRLLDTKPQVLISAEGIEDKRLNLGLIKWSEISSIFSNKMSQAQWFSINLILPENYQKRLPVFARLMRKINGESELNSFRIGFTELDKSIDEAFDYILEVKFEKVICKRLGM